VWLLSVEQIIEIHARVIHQSGGSSGLRDRGSLESSVLQPLQVFGGRELYPSLVEKAAALGYFLIQNHPFVDGNKRIGHAAMETLLVLNGFEISASVEEQEVIILSVAQSARSLVELTEWLAEHLAPIGSY
jgi:death on curing protein